LKRIVFGIILIIISLAILHSALKIRPVKAYSPDPYTINPDGSITPSTTSIVSSDNVTYTLTADINDGIIVRKGGIVLDGNDHTLNGSFTGVDVTYLSNVAIQHISIMNCYYGINLDTSSNVKVLDCNITRSAYGLFFAEVQNTLVNGNHVYNNSNYGIYANTLYRSNITENQITQDNCSMYFVVAINNTISQNAIDDNAQFGIYSAPPYFRNNNITYNSINNNTLYGIYLDESSTNNTISHNDVKGNGNGVYTYSGSENYITYNNVANNGENGIWLDYYSGGNTVVGNNITYNGNHGAYLSDESSGNYITYNNIASNGYGIWLDYYSDRNAITYNDLANSGNCSIYLVADSDHNTISDNTFTGSRYGIYSYHSANNTVSYNSITGTSEYGTYLEYVSDDNTFFGNTIGSNGIRAIYVSQSMSNRIYHNNFLNNFSQAATDLSPNTWDDGYPSGGNYWGNYLGVDIKNGTNQDGSASDGIGDTVLTIDGNNIDHYPLMGPFQTLNAGTWNGAAYYVDLVSNSTITNLGFNPNATPNPTLNFTVAGKTGTTGFCRITIPKNLVWCDNPDQWLITIDGSPITQRNIIETDNYTYIYFAYTHSTHTIGIEGMHAVPEFETSTVAITLVAATLLAAAAYKRKRDPKDY
jgi:parallel beta-helix repeat protein